MSEDFVRGRSQIMFKYLPGAIFYKDGRYFKVTNIVPDKVTYDTSRLREEVQRFIEQWPVNKVLEVSLFPKDPKNLYFSEIQSVEYEIFPLVFYCENCRNVHEYWDLNSLIRDNKSLKCVFCSKLGNLKQYPYVMVHENGDIKALKVTKHPNAKSFKEKYAGITMHDTRSFTTSTWYNNITKTSLSSLGANITDKPRTKEMNVFMSGKHATDGDVFKPAIINLVNLNNEELLNRKNNPDFPAIQLGSLLNLEKISKDDFASNYTKKESTNSIQKMLEAASNETERQLLLQILANSGQSHLTEENSVTKEISDLSQSLGINIDSNLILQDHLLHEYLYSIYENESSTLDDKIKEAEETKDFLQKQILEDSKNKLSILGISNTNLLDKFPVLTLSPGFTRKSSNREEVILNPYRLKIQNSIQTVIPTMLNENEAIIFKVDSSKILQWLSANNFLKAPKETLTQEESELFLYNSLKMADFEPSELAEAIIDFEDFSNNKNLCALVFQLIHTLSHMMLNSGKSVIGLDIDSISEYIFPSANAFAIYVSKLQGGGMGNLIAAFENDLEKWIFAAYEQAQLCLYDPICKDYKAACHACSYLKFSCQHFNRGLSRSLLIGGHVKGKKIIGFLERPSNV